MASCFRRYGTAAAWEIAEKSCLQESGFMILFFRFKRTTMLVHCGRTRSGMHETEGSRERRLAVDAYASHPALFYLCADSPIRKSRGPMQGEAGIHGKPVVIA
jgi:hypothetical protein